MAHDPTDRFLLAHRLALVGSLCLGAFASTVCAQGYPGGGGGMGRRSSSLEERVKAARPGEARLRPNVLELFAAGLEKEASSMNLPPPTAKAMQDLVREMKDFGALDDRHVRERLGWTRGTVHAAVDVQRDLSDVEESAHETAAAAADVMARWKALQPLLNEAQRDRVDAVYRGALSDAAASPSQSAK
jgi:hypothetical protein